MRDVAGLLTIFAGLAAMSGGISAVNPPGPRPWLFIPGGVLVAVGFWLALSKRRKS